MSDARPSRGWPVRARHVSELPVAAGQAWTTLGDFRRVVCQDHFHRDVRLHGPGPAQGVAFDLPHGFLGLRVARRGRILRWTEGRGYAFSDLSARDPQRVFPHVFELTLEPGPAAAGGPGSRMVLEIRGRWTAHWLPRWLVDAWLRWNTWSMGVALARLLLADAIEDGTQAGSLRESVRRRG